MHPNGESVLPKIDAWMFPAIDNHKHVCLPAVSVHDLDLMEFCIAPLTLQMKKCFVCFGEESFLNHQLLGIGSSVLVCAVLFFFFSGTVWFHFGF